MKKYVVYFENWNSAEEDKVFDKEEDAEKYIEEQEDTLSCEECLYIEVEER